MEKSITLKGSHVCLEPMDFRHADGLVAASAIDPSLYFGVPFRRERKKFINIFGQLLNGGKLENQNLL